MNDGFTALVHEARPTHFLCASWALALVRTMNHPSLKETPNYRNIPYQVDAALSSSFLLLRTSLSFLSNQSKMAARLTQLRSKATEVSQFVTKHGCAYYKDLMAKNKHYVVDPPTVEKCQELSKQLFYTRLASLPGRYQSFWKELDSVKGVWKNRSELKVEDAGIAALFGLELYCWYCAGEIVGRGFTLTGYKV